MEALVEIEALDVCYGRFRALDGLSVKVLPGATGLLGANGAGKTTLIRVLLGLLKPKTGRVRVLGLDPSKKNDRVEIRRRLGFMPENECLMPNMSGLEIVTLLGRLAGLSTSDATVRAHEVLDYVDLEEERYREALGYSTGIRQRLKLAQALVHDPDFLVLDEPTNGLDPISRAEVLRLIQALAVEHGKSLLLCTHLLNDVETLCTQAIVLNQGRVLLTTAISDLNEHSGTEFAVRVDPVRVREFEAELLGLGLKPGVGARGTIRLLVPESHCDVVFEAAARAGTSILALDPIRTSLEDVFAKAIGGGPR